MTTQGRLTISLAQDSMFLGSSLPVEVRDANLRLVQRISGNTTLDLPIGLYEVSAVLGDGQRHQAYVEVMEGDARRIELGEAAPLATSAGDDYDPQTSSDDPLPNASRYQRATYTSSSAQQGEDASRTGDLPGLELIELTGATVVELRRTQISIKCDPQIKAVPTAEVAVGSQHLLLSLPISPETYTPSGAGVITVERRTRGLTAQAWISPERRVANGLQNMLSTGQLIEAAQLAEQAIELLRGKYEDPTGAALGALLLNKAGRLARWESWLENLARDFAWLPDGRVLLVQQRRTRGEGGDDDLTMLLEASRQRVLYAETCSILIDLLRRWPESNRAKEIDAAIEFLATDSPYIDRDSICLTVWRPGHGEE